MLFIAIFCFDWYLQGCVDDIWAPGRNQRWGLAPNVYMILAKGVVSAYAVTREEASPTNPKFLHVVLYFSMCFNQVKYCLLSVWLWRNIEMLQNEQSVCPFAEIWIRLVLHRSLSQKMTCSFIQDGSFVTFIQSNISILLSRWVYKSFQIVCKLPQQYNT